MAKEILCVPVVKNGFGEGSRKDLPTDFYVSYVVKIVFDLSYFGINSHISPLENPNFSIPSFTL